jgi:hypothetical protein
VTVIVSDMRMPGMDGAQLLERCASLAPLVTRMLLTGYADLDAAVAAVNHGKLFRFLTKPCRRDDLREHVAAAVELNRLQRAERELLEQTLRGSIQVLVDILALTNPAAFGRAHRIKTRSVTLAKQLGLEELWQIEIAALASQLGYISLPHELCHKLEHGHTLNVEDQKMLARAPATTATLLAHIPRLEGVREILSAHMAPPPRTPNATPRQRSLELAAYVLRFALDLDALETANVALTAEVIRSRVACDSEVLQAFCALNNPGARSTRDVPVRELRVGMVLAEDVRLASGALLVARGYEITAPFIERLHNFPPGTISALLPVAA